MYVYVCISRTQIRRLWICLLHQPLRFIWYFQKLKNYVLFFPGVFSTQKNLFRKLLQLKFSFKPLVSCNPFLLATFQDHCIFIWAASIKVKRLAERNFLFAVILVKWRGMEILMNISRFNEKIWFKFSIYKRIWNIKKKKMIVFETILPFYCEFYTSKFLTQMFHKRLSVLFSCTQRKKDANYDFCSKTSIFFLKFFLKNKNIINNKCCLENNPSNLYQRWGIGIFFFTLI